MPLKMCAHDFPLLCCKVAELPTHRDEKWQTGCRPDNSNGKELVRSIKGTGSIPDPHIFHTVGCALRSK